MTPKMVAKFRRSLSFPNHPIAASASSSSSSTSSSSSKVSSKKKGLHVRSTSLPCRSHPLIFQLKDQINDLNSSFIFPTTSTDVHNGTIIPDHRTQARTSALVCDGLTRLKTVHESLDDLLQHPQTRESLLSCTHYSQFLEIFLEDCLRFIDIYGIFQTLLLKLKEEHSAAQVALRRRDDSKLILYLKTLKKMAKELLKLASALQCMPSTTHVLSHAAGEVDAELINDAINDVIQVTVLVSVALFSGLAVSLSCRHQKKAGSTFCLNIAGSTKRSVKMVDEGIQEFQQIFSALMWDSKKKGDHQEELKYTSKRMHELEDCITEIEIRSEKVFRSLINTRVSLLNILTQ